MRAVAGDDNAALAGLLREVMEEFGAAGAGSSIHDPELQDMASAYAAAGSAYFVVEHHGRLVGGGGFGPLAGGAPEVCELRKMYLRPEARGHGLGRTMLARCLETARQNRLPAHVPRDAAKHARRPASLRAQWVFAGD